MKAGFSIALLVGGLSATAQLTPILPADTASQPLIVRSGESHALWLAVRTADNLRVSSRVTSQLWQIAGNLAAPVSPVATHEVGLVNGVGTLRITNEIPVVRQPTPMLVRFEIEGSQELATTRLLVVTGEPLRELANEMTNHVWTLVGAAGELADWLETRGVKWRLDAAAGESLKAPSLALLADRAGERWEDALARVKTLTAGGIPLIWFRLASSPDGFEPIGVQWHYWPGAAPLVCVPVAWQSRLASDLPTEYQFTQIVRAALDPRSPARLLTVTTP